MTRRILLTLCIIFIVYGGTLPFRFTADPDTISRNLQRVRMNPLVSASTGGRVSIPDAVQNILLFLPLGGLAVLTFRTRGVIAEILLASALGAALSITVETVQLFTVDRISSVSDVAANTLGTALGAFATARLRDVVSRALTRAHASGHANDSTYHLLVALAVTCVAAWEPFDVTLDVSTVATKIHALARDPWQFTGLNDEGISFLLHTLLAVAISQWLESRKAAVRLQGIALGFLIATALEASQFGFTSRMPGLEDLAVRWGGLLLGVWLWHVGRKHRVRAGWVVGLVVVGTAAGAALQQLSPFEVRQVYAPLRWYPFLSNYEHSTFDGLSHAIELILTYFPLGFIVSQTWSPRRAIVLGLVVTFAIAAPIEFLQGWVVGRYADVTDIAISLAGASFGLLAGTRGATAFRRGTALSIC